MPIAIPSRVHRAALTAALLAAATVVTGSGVVAQVSTILFTGRFPFTSLDVGNERPGGTITELTEYDFSWSIPVPGGGLARSLMPATAMHCYLGDADFDGSYLKFRGWRTSYFENVGIGGLFVREADRDAVAWHNVYFNVRIGSGTAGQQFEIFLPGGIPYLVEPADWMRFLPNGEAEFFLAPGQLLAAAGPQTGNPTVGAGALLQAANGDLYYSPSDGGHWVSGNVGGPFFAEDGAICKIDAAAISYDVDGNVAGLAPGSARLLINESVAGPSGNATVHGWVDQAGAMDHLGNALQATGTYGLTTGLAFDPGGGAGWQPTYPDASGANLPEPHLIFCSEAESYAGTLFSSRNGGSVPVLNGALCGSTSPGVPADGAWLGVQVDVSSFRPSLLGFTLVGIPPQSLVADVGDFGSLDTAANQANLTVDFHGAAGLPLFALASLGPHPPQAVVPAIPSASLPLAQAAQSWSSAYLVLPVTALGATTTDAFGYATVAIPNPNSGSFAGLTFVLQGLALSGSALQLSSPVLIQLR